MSSLPVNLDELYASRSTHEPLRYELKARGVCYGSVELGAGLANAELRTEHEHWVLERQGIFKTSVRGNAAGSHAALTYTTSWSGRRGLLASESGDTWCCRYQELADHAEWRITRREQTLVRVRMSSSERVSIELYEDGFEGSDLSLVMLASLYFALLHFQQASHRMAAPVAIA
jgi:hypothetical protein